MIPHTVFIPSNSRFTFNEFLTCCRRRWTQCSVSDAETDLTITKLDPQVPKFVCLFEVKFASLLTGRCPKTDSCQCCHSCTCRGYADIPMLWNVSMNVHFPLSFFILFSSVLCVSSSFTPSFIPDSHFRHSPHKHHHCLAFCTKPSCLHP